MDKRFERKEIFLGFDNFNNFISGCFVYYILYDKRIQELNWSTGYMKLKTAIYRMALEFHGKQSITTNRGNPVAIICRR